MKKFNRIWMWMAIAAASFSFTSCDDDDYWHDDYYWYDDYNHGGWEWNQGDWNNGSNGSQDDYLLSEAQTLTGDWRGSVMLSELAEDGQSRNNYSFNAEMTFYQAGDKVNSLSGNGVEVDYADDGSNETQTLKFAWYIDKNGDIYIRLNSATVSINRLSDSKLSLWCLGALFDCCISRDKPFHPLTPPSDLRQYAVENRQEIRISQSLY